MNKLFLFFISIILLIGCKDNQNENLNTPETQEVSAEKFVDPIFTLA